MARRTIEAELVSPHRLQDVIYCNIPQKVYKKRFGPIIAHLISMWNSLQSLSNTDLKFHAFLPLYNNYSLHQVVHRRIGLRLFSFPQWSGKGIYTLADVLKDGTLRSFEDLCKTYDISNKTHYIFLQIRRALESYGSGVPWGEGSSRHPLVDGMGRAGPTGPRAWPGPSGLGPDFSMCLAARSGFWPGRACPLQ